MGYCRRSHLPKLGFRHSLGISEAIDELKSDNDDRLNLELALFERFFEFFQVDSQKLHHQIVVVLV